MSRVEMSGTTWADLRGPVQVNGASSQGAKVEACKSTQLSKDWEAVVSGPLSEWQKDPQRLEDDGIVAPSRETIQRAVKIASELCALGLAAPQRVAATGDGGVVLARQEGEFFSSIEVMSDGSAELAVYRGCRLVSRQRII